MSDEPTTPGTESWAKSKNITRALGLPFTSLFGAIQFIRGWKAGTFSADNLQAVFETGLYLALMVYYPVHAAVVWIRKRIAAGNDPCNPEPKIVPPKIVESAIRTTKEITKDISDGPKS